MLSIGGRQLNELDLQMRNALYASAPVGFYDAALETRSPLGNDKSVNDDGLIQRREKGVAGLIVIGRERLADANG